MFFNIFARMIVTGYINVVSHLGWLMTGVADGEYQFKDPIFCACLWVSSHDSTANTELAIGQIVGVKKSLNSLYFLFINSEAPGETRDVKVGYVYSGTSEVQFRDRSIQPESKQPSSPPPVRVPEGYGANWAVFSGITEEDLKNLELPDRPPEE